MEQLSVETPGIVATRQTKERFGILVVAGFCGHKCTSGYDRSYVFPGWVGPGQGGLLPSGTSLMNEAFIKRVRSGLSTSSNNYTPTEHDIFHYIVALLSAPGYEDRFRENLKREFPRVFLAADGALFRKFAQHGADLTGLFLLQRDYGYASWNSPHAKSKNPLEAGIVSLKGAKQTEVGPGYPCREGQRVYINSSTWFEGIEESSWVAYVGAFQVCEKWLKDRRGRSLSDADLDHYSHIVNAVREIQRLRAAIQSAIMGAGGWPLAGSISASL